MDVVQHEGDLGVVLDQTVFYAQGGGQPGDRGTIKLNDNCTFQVTKTIKNEGRVLHLGSFVEGASFEAGAQVQLSVNKEFRELVSFLHSAGHLIDMAVRRVGLDWTPVKGSHFPDACFVEYNSKSASANSFIDADLAPKIQAEYDSLVQQDLPVKVTIDYSQQHQGLPLRQVSFAGMSTSPCGGTHVHSTCKLGNIKITKIKSKNGISKVSYEIDK